MEVKNLDHMKQVRGRTEIHNQPHNLGQWAEAIDALSLSSCPQLPTASTQVSPQRFILVSRAWFLPEAESISAGSTRRLNCPLFPTTELCYPPSTRRGHRDPATGPSERPGLQKWPWTRVEGEEKFEPKIEARPHHELVFSSKLLSYLNQQLQTHRMEGLGGGQSEQVTWGLVQILDALSGTHVMGSQAPGLWGSCQKRHLDNPGCPAFYRKLTVPHTFPFDELPFF